MVVYDLDIKQAGLAALQSDRSSAYNQHMDGYNMLLTNLGNYQTQSDTAYNRYLNQLQMQQEAAEQAREEQLAKAQLLAEAGDYSLLAQYYGLTKEQLTPLYQNETGGDADPAPGDTGTDDGDIQQTNAVKDFIAQHMTLEQAQSRGITRKEYVAMVKDWLNSADLSDGEFEYLEKHYGIG